MYRFEDSLPRIPVPTLQETAVHYLKSVHPLLSTTEYAETTRAVEEFVKAGGVGEKLIDYVAERAREADAYQLYWHTQYFNYRAQGLYAKVGERSDLVLWKKGL